MTLWDTKKGVSEGFLYPDTAAASPREEKPLEKGQNEGLSSYLGIYTKSCKQDAEEKRLWIEKQKQKQDSARNLIGGRLELCGRVPVPTNLNGDMIHLPDELRNLKILKNDENFYFGGLMRCGSVWSCPDCASIISGFRRNELIEAFSSALAQGLSISMLTLTVPHYAKDNLEDVLNGLQRALRTMKNRKSYKDFVKQVGVVGNIRALEPTYGVNGWHPHFHIILFTEKNIDAQLDEFKKHLLAHWKSACVSSGLPCPNEHGLDLVNGTWAASYVSKWGVAEEMTKGHLKKCKKDGHISPFGLLELYADGDKNAGKQFQEYARVFKGRRQLVWSKGLREMLKVRDQISDENVIAEVEKKSEVFMTITYQEYKKILNEGRQAECLFLCSQGKNAVRAWLDKLMSPDRDLSFP